MPICKICNKHLDNINKNHLKKHDIDTAQYLKLYPNAELISEEYRKKLSTNNLQFWIKQHGEELGTQKYKEYKEFLGIKNTYAYKNEKFGWNKNKFNKFNKSRAVTKENLIKKHGEIKGLKKYEEYCLIQKDNGCSLKYFKEKYGNEDGEQFYLELNKKKAATLENYIRIYKDVNIAKQKLKKWLSKLVTENNTSKIELEFMEKLLFYINENAYVFCALRNKQFGKWCHITNKYRFFDFCDLENKKIIEFHGDYWHCNPRKYSEEYFHDIMKKTAKEIWEDNDHKKLLAEKHGFEYKVIWENDYRNDAENIVKECIEWLSMK